MPLHEYECDACGHRFEVIQKFSDPPIEKCPKCGSVVRKLQASPAIQFKGSGWYITDYARKGSGEAAAKTESGSKDGAPGATDASPKADQGATSGESSGSTSSGSSTTETKK